MFKSTAFSAMVSGLNIDFKSTEFNSSSGINVCKASISFSIGNIKTFSLVKFNEFLKGKESLDRYLEQISKEKKRKEKIRKKRNEPKLIQPSMRFTARTDFERVYDILKNRQVLYEEEKILKNQLAKMGFTSQNIEENEEDEESEKINENEMILNKKKENLTDEEILQKERHNKIIQQRKNMINKRKFLLNINQDKDKKL